MKIIHFGSYWMGKNDIVYLMAETLSRLSETKVICIDPNLYGNKKSKMIEAKGRINWIKASYIKSLVEKYNPDIIICNAGGLSPTKEAHDWLEKRGVKRIGIALSDPDDFPERSKYFAGLFSFFFTNALLSLNDYQGIGVKAFLLPFAADATFHRPLDIKKKYDIVVVGGKRPDRVLLVNSFKSIGLKVGCFGSGWAVELFPLLKIIDKLPSRISNILKRVIDFPFEVHGEKHVKALNSALIYCSFSNTVAGFVNVKVGLFEAAACGCCILSPAFSELNRYFQPQKELFTFNSLEDALNKALYLKDNPQKARAVGAAVRIKLVKEHTWEHRWQYIMDIISN